MEIMKKNDSKQNAFRHMLQDDVAARSSYYEAWANIDLAPSEMK